MNKRIFFTLCALALLSLLSGCALGSRIFKSSQKPYNHPVLLYEYQARFIDIPFPFDAEIVPEEFNKYMKDEHQNNPLDSSEIVLNHQFIIVCSTKMLSSDLCTLYHTEMEQLGWRERAFFKESARDFTAVFEKPNNKFCIISVRSSCKKAQEKLTIHYYLA